MISIRGKGVIQCFFFLQRDEIVTMTMRFLRGCGEIISFFGEKKFDFFHFFLLSPEVKFNWRKTEKKKKLKVKREIPGVGRGFVVMAGRGLE